MSKKKIIIIISVVLGLLLVALLGYYFLLQGTDGDTGGVVSIFKSFFPFGGEETPTYQTPTDNPGGNGPTKPQDNYLEKLRKLSTEPVAGAGIVDVAAGSVVNYIEKATGHIYEAELFSAKKTRVSNTTFPLVYDAIWGNKNNSLIARYLKEDDVTVDTYSLSLKGLSTSTENSVSGSLFPNGISDVSAIDTSVFFLQQKEGSSLGFVSNFDGKNIKQIWSSPIKELLSQYVNEKTVALTTKPEMSVPGFLYFVNTSTAGVQKILGDIPGLSTLVSPNANYVLLFSSNNQASTYLYNNTNKTFSSIVPITFPEKCVWSKKDLNIIYCAVPQSLLGYDSLISWYKGLVSFSDDIWKYDIKNNTSDIVANLSTLSGESIDVIKPILSDSEQYLIFINKTDNDLWSLDLTK